ncbi:YlxR family protein [Arthrobacter alpinus]|nr:YlxR family protein [Arthrobacter alpinus]
MRSSNSSGELEALVDVRRRMPGRGAWLHPILECWNLAIKRRAVGRALPGSPNCLTSRRLRNRICHLRQSK